MVGTHSAAPHRTCCAAHLLQASLVQELPQVAQLVIPQGAYELLRVQPRVPQHLIRHPVAHTGTEALRG